MTARALPVLKPSALCSPVALHVASRSAATTGIVPLISRRSMHPALSPPITLRAVARRSATPPIACVGLASSHVQHQMYRMRSRAKDLGPAASGPPPGLSLSTSTTTIYTRTAPIIQDRIELAIGQMNEGGQDFFTRRGLGIL